MEKLVHTFKINLDWQLVNLISRIDRFDSSWSSIEKREGQSLKQLKSISTVRSVGASTRIEGSKMSDEEVEILLREVDIRRLEDRDSQEVVGYYEALELISEAFGNLMITEGELKNLHNVLMKYSEKDQWHKGQYKQHNNSVEATLPDGTKQILFKTTEAGYQTNEAMRQLIEWYKGDNQTHPLVKSVLFAYDFVSIHPFQDGNGRLSRLVTTLLLLKNGYNWIQYVSLEHEIESRKAEYYRVLMGCQIQRPNEDVSDWVKFILDALQKTQESLMQKLDTVGMKNRLSPKEKSLVTYIADHPGCKSGEIAKNLGIPNPTVKRILPILVEKNLIERFGTGPGTYYTIK
jgi:Fic family protein